MRQGFLFLIIVSIVFCAPVMAYDWSTNPGDGSEANPYQISTPEQLIAIGADANLLDKDFVLMNDIVFDPNNNPEHVFDKAPIAPDTQYDWGGKFQGTPFTGCFDGNGFSILNLKIVNDIHYSSDHLGLFGFIEGSTSSVSIKNLSLIRPVIIAGSSADQVGSLCGELKDGSVKNCHVTSFVVTCDWIYTQSTGLGGLVGYNDNGLIEDCSVRCNFYTAYNAVGGVAGLNAGIITDCKVNCMIMDGQGYYVPSVIGGIAGLNTGAISKCFCEGYIQGSYSAGGVIGRNNGDCSNTFFTGTLSFYGGEYDYGCGGFVGENGGSIYECYAISQINVKGWLKEVGGFVGRNGAAIDQCGSWSRMICESSYEPLVLGGFVGFHEDGTISNSYSQGAIQTNNENIRSLGGFAGRHYSGIYKSYSTVKQTHKHLRPDKDYSIGGFIGASYPYENYGGFYDVERSNMIPSPYVGSTGLAFRTSQMQSKTVYLQDGWDFTGEEANGTDDVWQIETGDYPRLAWLPRVTVPGVLEVSLRDAQVAIESAGLTVGEIRYHYSDSVPAEIVTIQSLQPDQEVIYGREVHLWVSNGQSCPYSGGGEGTEQKPCRIATADDLILLGQTQSDYDKCFVLTGDIDMSPSVLQRSPFIEAVIAPVSFQSQLRDYWYLGGSFRGSLNGNNYSITNLQIKAPDGASYIGLIGRLYSGTVRNLSLGNIDYSCSKVLGGLFDAGGMTGVCVAGTISGCSVTGEMSESNYSGGLAGSSICGDISNCDVTVDMQGGYATGGLLGENAGNVSMCNANGTVAGNIYSSGLGGLVSVNYGYISRSNASGTVGVEGYNNNDTVWGAGGLVGTNHGTIYECMFLGEINADYMCGGLVGINVGSIISSCFKGIASGEYGAGGICRMNRGSIQYCYSSGELLSGFGKAAGICECSFDFGEGIPGIEQCYSTCSLETSAVPPEEKSVGLVGYLASNLIDCYWDTLVSKTLTGYHLYDFWVPEQAVIENVQGYTTPQMFQQASFVNWDFENIWWIDEGNDYPRLRWEIHAVPIADAGEDQVVFAGIDGAAMVSLDGTGSYDPDGDVLEYFWLNDANELIATGAEPNVVLPVGEHVIELIVNDGIADSEPNSCLVTVVDPFAALAGDIVDLVKHDGIANSLLAKLDAAMEKLADGNENNDGAAAGSLRALINAVNAQRGKKITEEDADSLISLAEYIISML